MFGWSGDPVGIEHSERGFDCGVAEKCSPVQPAFIQLQAFFVETVIFAGDDILVFTVIEEFCKLGIMGNGFGGQVEFPLW